MESINKYPFVLVSGLFFPTYFGSLNYFHRIVASLEEKNVKIILPKLTAFEPHKPRVERLIRELDRLYPEGKFHLVGHGRGGNDGCALLQNKRFENRVLSITTINTPHSSSKWGKELFLTNGDHVAPIGFPFGLLPRFDQCGFFRDVIFQIRKELPDASF